VDDYDICLDSETLDSLNDAAIARLPPTERVSALRFGFAATYDEIYGWRTWTTSLVNMLWTHLSMSGARVVGWDILDYDLPVIAHAADSQPQGVVALDLSAEIAAATGRRYKLDTIARANLGRGKILDTPLVIEWLRKGDSASMQQVTAHCRNNVQLVLDLMALIQRGQPLLLPGRLQPSASGWPKTNEATWRLHFEPMGEWRRCEDLRGVLVKER
jgi:hypothetical protein